ncbi:MAG: hypothetical protein HOY69_37285 [Streptomyces sp.]|nr:hypothetical protein [Streptomyces sp.]
MGGTTQQATVPNPAITDLKSLKARLQGELATLNDTLKTTNSDMGGKKVWVGSAADTWATEISGRRTRIQQLLGKLVPIIDAEIATLPEKVTPLDAKLYNMDRPY